jgi:hypothetical protein
LNPVVNGLRRIEITLAFRDSLGGRRSNPDRSRTPSGAHSDRPRAHRSFAASQPSCRLSRDSELFSCELYLAHGEPHVPALHHARYDPCYPELVFGLTLGTSAPARQPGGAASCEAPPQAHAWPHNFKHCSLSFRV